MDDDLEPTPDQPKDPRDAHFERFLAAYDDDAERALGELMAAVQDELRAIAERVRQKRPQPPSFGATDLVNEVYLRLIGSRPHVNNVTHFFAIAARTMRWILVSRERKRRSHEDVNSGIEESKPDVDEIDVIALHEALLDFDGIRPECVKVVELRFFAGLTVAQIAEVMKISEATVNRRLREARKWLEDKLGE